MKEKTEREKMLDGELYLATDQELVVMQNKASQLLHDFNFSQPHQVDLRKNIVLPSVW